MTAHKKPAKYRAHMPFAVALIGVHRFACRDVQNLYELRYRDTEVLIGLQYALQVSARDMLGVSIVCKIIGRGTRPNSVKKIRLAMTRLLVLRMVVEEKKGERVTLYGLTALGAEVIRYYQRMVFHHLDLASHYENLEIKFKYFSLNQLPKSALDKGRP